MTKVLNISAEIFVIYNMPIFTQKLNLNFGPKSAATPKAFKEIS